MLGLGFGLGEVLPCILDALPCLAPEESSLEDFFDDLELVFSSGQVDFAIMDF